MPALECDSPNKPRPVSLFGGASSEAGMGMGGAPPKFAGGKPRAAGMGLGGAPPSFIGGQKPEAGMGMRGAPPKFAGGAGKPKRSPADMPALPGSESPNKISSLFGAGRARGAATPSSDDGLKRKKRRPPESFEMSQQSPTDSGGGFGSATAQAPHQASLYVSSPQRSVSTDVRRSALASESNTPKAALPKRNPIRLAQTVGKDLEAETVETEWGKISPHSAAILEKRKNSTPPLFFGTCKDMISPQEYEKRTTEKLPTATFEADEQGELRGKQVRV